MPHAEEISRSVLSDHIKERLLEAILDGRYPPGSRIVETRVAREFGTSQAPVREALRDLEALGVVEIAPFRGARVRRPTADELLEAFAVRSELESLAVRLAAPTLTDDDLAELERRVGEMHASAEGGLGLAESIADATFHGRLVELAGNATLFRVWRLLEPASRTYITIVVPGADRRQIAALHDPVLDALRTRDPEAAAEAIRRHFAEARDMLAGLWAEPDKSQDAQRPPRARRAAARRAPARGTGRARRSPALQPSERTS